MARKNIQTDELLTSPEVVKQS